MTNTQFTEKYRTRVFIIIVLQTINSSVLGKHKFDKEVVVKMEKTKLDPIKTLLVHSAQTRLMNVTCC